MAWAGLSGVCRCCRPCWARCSDPRARAGRPLLPSTRVPEPESQVSSRHTGRAPPAPLRAQGHTQPDTNMEGHTCLEAEVASARTEDQTDSCSRGWELSSIWADTSCYGLTMSRYDCAPWHPEDGLYLAMPGYSAGVPPAWRQPRKMKWWCPGMSCGVPHTHVLSGVGSGTALGSLSPTGQDQKGHGWSCLRFSTEHRPSNGLGVTTFGHCPKGQKGLASLSPPPTLCCQPKVQTQGWHALPARWPLTGSRIKGGAVVWGGHQRRSGG